MAALVDPFAFFVPVKDRDEEAEEAAPFGSWYRDPFEVEVYEGEKWDGPWGTPCPRGLAVHSLQEA